MKQSISRRHFLAGSLAAAALASTPAFARGGRASSQATIVPLSDSELNLLVFMREEEKLARDVYLAMYNMWQHIVFNNIAVSEQRHMDTMKKLLDKYQIQDPAQSAAGAFTDQGLQSLYDTLIARGSKSLVDALIVGCTIEDVDIRDLQLAIDSATHVDLDVAFQHLMDGSGNHMRAFVSALGAEGASYVPQYISQELFDAIIGV
jgi:hypothetical protein